MGSRSYRLPDRLGSTRGQAGFDFLVGMSVFLITVGVVFTSVPGIFQPFESETGPNMVVADRSASLLVEDYLVDDVTKPSILNESCSVDFFDGDTDDSSCRFDHNGTALHAALSVDEFSGVNVTIESNGSILTLDAGNSVDAAAGRAPPSTADVVVGKRAVTIGGKRGVLFVRVW